MSILTRPSGQPKRNLRGTSLIDVLGLGAAGGLFDRNQLAVFPGRPIFDWLDVYRNLDARQRRPDRFFDLAGDLVSPAYAELTGYEQMKIDEPPGTRLAGPQGMIVHVVLEKPLNSRAHSRLLIHGKRVIH